MRQIQHLRLLILKRGIIKVSKDRYSRLNIENSSRRINAGFTFQNSREDKLIRNEYVHGSVKQRKTRKGATKKVGNRRRYEETNEFGDIGNGVAHILFTLLTFIYFEVLFHLFMFKTLGEFIGYPILFALPVGLVVLILTSVFSTTANKVIMWVILGVAELVYITEIVFMSIFKIPLLFTDMGAGNLQVVVYWKETLITIGKCLPIIIMFIMPLIIYGILLKLGMVMNRKSIMLTFGYGVFTVMFAILSLLAVNMSDKESNNIYDNYHDMYDTAAAVENYGIFTTLRLNAAKLIGGDSNEIDVDDLVIGTPAPIITMAPDTGDGSGENNSDVIDTSPNMMNIDFVKLAQEEDDKTIKKLNQYFASLMPTMKNEYTGMFEGYNLIYITGEAFSPYAVDKELTPTLYKLTHGGFMFTNYYVPHTGESTCGGEFMNCTGLLTNPNRPRGVYTFYQIKENYMPFSMGNQFKRIGINPIAYHNNSLSYYDRYITLPNLGYKFKAANAGSIKDSEAKEQGLLFHMDHPSQWPQSDLEMMTYTGGEYISDKQFHAYYMTISGHMLYTFSGNSMASKNKELVEGLPYSENCKAYIACNIELDRALEELMRQLEEKGVLDKTVICLSSDHYPYGLTNEEISELAGHDIEENFELYKNNLILYNSAMEPVTIDKPCSSIDIIPTLSNLFGFTYDSRLLPGKDILSDSEGLVIMMNNRSFITDELMYNASTKKVTDLEGNSIDVSNDKIKELKDMVNLKIAMNQLLIENDYYDIIRDHLKFD